MKSNELWRFTVNEKYMQDKFDHQEFIYSREAQVSIPCKSQNQLLVIIFNLKVTTKELDTFSFLGEMLDFLTTAANNSVVCSGLRRWPREIQVADYLMGLLN